MTAAWVAIGISSVSLVVAGSRLPSPSTSGDRIEHVIGLSETPTRSVRRSSEHASISRPSFPSGANPTRYFISEENKHTGQRLRDAANRTTDAVLSTLLFEAAQAWDDAAGAAPPPSRAHSSWGGSQTETDTQRTRQNDREVEKAEEGLQQCEAALARVNDLDLTL